MEPRRATEGSAGVLDSTSKSPIDRTGLRGYRRLRRGRSSQPSQSTKQVQHAPPLVAIHGRSDLVPKLSHMKIAGKGQIQDCLPPGEGGDRARPQDHASCAQIEDPDGASILRGQRLRHTQPHTGKA